MRIDYTYAVARIRAKELGLFGQPVMEQLISCRTMEEAIRFLADKGWGDPEKPMTQEGILEAENEKTWKLIGEMVPDMSAFDVFRISEDYQNLKAAIKLAYTHADLDPSRVYTAGGTLDPKVLSQAAVSRDFSALPETMAAAAAEAQDTLLHTGDGQLCDIILDREALEAIDRAGEAAEHEVLKTYARLTVAAADIRIAVRCARVGKSMDFMQRALADCRELDTQALARAALNGVDGVADYLANTDYAAGADALRQSFAAFERWCDDLIIRQIQPQKYNPFTIGPLAAYILARQNEIKCVRMILTGRQNGLPEEAIRERLREMYV